MGKTPYPLEAVRALALKAQGLCDPPAVTSTPDLQAIYKLVEQLGCVQIDTLQMVQRSQYLVVWSRLGDYDPVDLDRLVYDPAQRRLFEGWLHAACLVPLAEYRFQMPHMRYLQEDPAVVTRTFLAQPGGPEMVDEVMKRIREGGAVRGGDFPYDGPKRGSWWDWKPAKQALEHLYATGELMVADRHNFQRVYDLTERVLPDWVDLSEPTAEERDRHWVELKVRTWGACTATQAGSDIYHRKSVARTMVKQLLQDGGLIAIQARLQDGEIHEIILHRENLPLLEQAAQGGLNPQRTTFLSPFDSLFWPAHRDLQLWGFRQTLEAYLPAAKRQWGYFCLPILHKDRLVGRFDPKLERGEGVLRIKALYLEPGIEPDEELVAGVAAAMGNFLEFHGAKELVIERSQPEEFGRKLLSKM
jgi:uncharacterized protein YcaQ